MKKVDEINDPTSCFRKARVDERIFVLLARDEAAPATIRFWCEERVRLGKNTIDSTQITEALRCAELMEQERAMIVK